MSRFFVSAYILFILLSFPTRIKSQVNLPFVKHLSINKLKREHLTYLSGLNPSSDTSAFLYAKYYLQYPNDSAFLGHYNKCTELFSKDTSATLVANIRFLKAKSAMRNKWFDLTVSKNTGFYVQKTAYVYQCIKNPDTVKTAGLPEELQPSFLGYKKAKRKKPVIAAGLSTLIPGLGQLYIGRKKSFATTLVTHIVYGLQSYESIRKEGIKAPLSIINLSILSFFYTANIYGSYTDTKKAKKEKQLQFLQDASDYYYITSSPSLY